MKSNILKRNHVLKAFVNHAAKLLTAKGGCSEVGITNDFSEMVRQEQQVINGRKKSVMIQNEMQYTDICKKSTGKQRIDLAYFYSERLKLCEFKLFDHEKNKTSRKSKAGNASQNCSWYGVRYHILSDMDKLEELRKQMSKRSAGEFASIFFIAAVINLEKDARKKIDHVDIIDKDYRKWKKGLKTGRRKFTSEMEGWNELSVFEVINNIKAKKWNIDFVKVGKVTFLVAELKS